MAQFTTIDDGEKDKDGVWKQINASHSLPIQAFKLKLNSEKDYVYNPGDVIEGKIFLKNNEVMGCLGIVVCLEGFASVSHKFGGTSRKKVEKLLSPSTNRWTTIFLVGCPEDYNNYTLAAYALRTSDKGRYYKIEAGEQIIPFAIKTAKLNPFPGTYSGGSGEINYRVIACVIIKVRDISRRPTSRRDYKFVERSLIFNSYLNLETLPLTQNPVSIESSNSSFLSTKKIKSTFQIHSTGYLPGETISFTLNVSNPHGRNISKFSVELIRKLVYFSDASSRVNSSVLHQVENNEINFDPDGNTEWADDFVIPSDLYPSTMGQLIQHQYSLKVGIYPAGKDSPVVRSLIPITIGTIREDESLSIENKPLPRSMSMMSLTSTTGSFESLPPSYSDLFSNSRTPTMETQPPLYEDVVS